MAIGSENLGNGSGKSDRFVGKYRGSRRDSGTAVEESPVNTDLGTTDLGADLGTSDVTIADRGPELPPELAPSGTSDRGPTLPSLDMGGLTEPVFPPAGWPDAPRTEPLVDHPLLRGLLLELPPKGTVPNASWLDRWFEAARAILELLYVQDSRTR